MSRFGFFSDVVDETVFYGSKQTWDGDDEFAPITNQDLELNLNDDNRVKTNTLIIPDGLETNVTEQAF